MKVTKLSESGYDEALMGMSLSYFKGTCDVMDWWDGQREKAQQRARVLHNKEGGHNKFLESMQVWLMVQGSRAFWQEFDTYRVGITKQSESTMHTLSKRCPTYDDFEIGTPIRVAERFMNDWYAYRDDIMQLKHSLPEGFLQRRVVCTNYKTLRNIVKQRTGHRYKHWKDFIEQLMNQLDHWEFLT